MPDRERYDHSFESARGTQQVPGHGLGGTHHDASGVITHHALHSDDLDRVTGGGRRAMRVDVIDFLGAHLSILEGAQHRARSAIAVLTGSRHMVRVGRGAVAAEFAQKRGLTPARVLFAFEHHHAGAFANHEAVPVLVKRTAGTNGVVVSLRQCAQVAEARHRDGRDGRFGSPRDNDIGIPCPDHAERFPDRMRP